MSDQLTQDCPLSAKDIEIVEWVSVGKTAQETADIIGSTVGSVKTKIQRATLKTDTVNATSLVAKALRNGWIS